MTAVITTEKKRGETPYVVIIASSDHNAGMVGPVARFRSAGDAVLFAMDLRNRVEKTEEVDLRLPSMGFR